MTQTALRPAVAGVEIRDGYEPGLVGWVTKMHGEYYADAWGSGAAFEIMMAREFSEFIEGYNPHKDLVLSAYVDGELAGSITIVGRHENPEGVQLRFFIVDPKFHGRGAGKELLNAALAWCRARRFYDVFLWTVDHLPQSRGLYEKVGFRVVERVPDDRYTVQHDNLKLKVKLAP